KDVLDPRLKDATAGLEEIERQATMEAFEDNNDGSDDDSNDDSTATSSGSEEDEEDTEGEEDISEGDEDTSEESAVEDEEKPLDPTSNLLTKYYPPDFDPSKIVRTRAPRGDVPAGPKVQTVRLMAPFSMKCTSCGEYIYKGRKFNARKETTDEKYYSISIFRFYIRCTRCSAEITFKTDPKGMDYTCERGAKRNFEIWRAGGETPAGETDEERLDRLEAEMGEKSAMEELEAKVVDAKQEMAIADALDEIRTRNARNERAVGGKEVVDV
ncbi:MAG: hypothetical protein Q9192_009056, partial [Flavoplaca navasiana]